MSVFYLQFNFVVVVGLKGAKIHLRFKALKIGVFFGRHYMDKRGYFGVALI